MQTSEVELSVPEGCQLILGQSHFIKTVDDVYEALVSSMPGLKFGVAFCESSGKALIRHDGTDADCIEVATDFAKRLSCGHLFVVVLRDAFPINVLNRIKNVEEVTTIYCATANRVIAVLVHSGGGRGLLGVIDGVESKGVENEGDKAERREFLRKIGYKR